MTTKQVQDLLDYLHQEYPGGDLSPGPLDGLDGPKTRAAITAFQKATQGLTATGQADEATQEALRQAVANGMTFREDEEGAKTGLFWDDIPNFTREEFRCKCGGKYCNGFPAEPQEAVVRLVQGARTHFDAEGLIVSGLRCKTWNAIQGGVANSQHMYGEAVDLYIQGVSGDRLLNYFLAQPGVRYAYKIEGSNNVHVDIPKGAR